MRSERLPRVVPTNTPQDPNAPVLTAIGKHIRSRARKPGLSPLPMTGSTPVAQAPVARKKRGGLAGTVDYSRAKVTVCPSPAKFGPAAKVHVDPATRVEGGFSDLGPGRYL
ncbi:MAG: hypothetical protein RJA55_1439 [Acidobacteriota bacterium]|jgi:hypothetical protein